LRVRTVGGHDTPLKRQQVQQLRPRLDINRPANERKLTQPPPVVRRPSVDHVERRLACGSVEQAPKRFAVDGHHALQGLGKALHETREAGLERRWVKKLEHLPEGVVARDAVP